MQVLEADLELGRKIRNENCGPELSPAHLVVGLMNLLQREIVIWIRGCFLRMTHLSRLLG